MEEKKKFISKIENVNKALNLASIWDYENEARMYKNQLLSDGYDEGHAEGIEETHTSIIKTMLKLNYSKEEISKVTGKSITEIEEISSKN